MPKLKWIMKQYWRVGTIRTILSLVLGMFVLGRLYYVYIPGLSNLGLFGALILGTILVLIFLGIGWLYDEKAKMWNQQIQASTERNPYVYISNYKSYAFDYPAIYGFLLMMKKIGDKIKLDIPSTDSILSYLDRFYSRKPTRQDIFSSLPDSEGFFNHHSFGPKTEEKDTKISLKSKIKLSFQIHLLRLTWIQSLTGLVQDVLVFGALYVVFFVPNNQEVVGGVVPVEYLIFGILFISFPLFILLATLGWFYDKKLKIWSPDIVVKIERNPYTYVAEPYLYIMVFPILNVIFNVLRDVMANEGIDTTDVDQYLQYLDKYSRFDVSRDKDMQEARLLRKELGNLFVDARGVE